MSSLSVPDSDGGGKQLVAITAVFLQQLSAPASHSQVRVSGLEEPQPAAAASATQVARPARRTKAGFALAGRSAPRQAGARL